MAIDVLQHIRKEHGELIASLKRLECGSGQGDILVPKVLEEIQHHIQVEKEYWFPEVSAVLEGVEGALDECSKNHPKIQSLIDTLSREGEALTDLRNELLKLLMNHFDREEFVILPKIRKAMSAEEREDLAEVLLDLKHTETSMLQ